MGSWIPWPSTRFISLDKPGEGGTFRNFDVLGGSSGVGDIFYFDVRGGPSKMVHLKIPTGGHFLKFTLAFFLLVYFL